MDNKALFTKKEMLELKHKYDFSNEFVAEQAAGAATFAAAAAAAGLCLLLTSDSPRK